MEILKSISLVAILLLSACATSSSPPPTLSEKLEGRSPQERQEVLRLACLNEAEWQKDQTVRHRTGKTRSIAAHRYYPEVSQLKALCREMTTAYLEGKE
jgi:outer membrane biogenesis lipoprotein LolB